MKTTYIPCVKGTIGDWTYYTTVMSVTDIVQYVEFAEQVCPNEDLDLMIQREVSERSTDIANYLRTNEQRFFGSLIIAVYDGKPRFLPVSFEGSDLLEPIKNRMGILQFDGQEKYYAVDGQHRLAAIIVFKKRNQIGGISKGIARRRVLRYDRHPVGDGAMRPAQMQCDAGHLGFRRFHRADWSEKGRMVLVNDRFEVFQ